MHARSADGWLGTTAPKFPAFILFAQNIAAVPHGADQISAAGDSELLAELADEDINDLHFRFINAAIKVIQEDLLGQHNALAEREQFQNGVFLTGQMHGIATDSDFA